ncbi:MAG: trypsin-like peptidase domain-containing protein [Chitinophagaceae bacterium]|nr:trypsin-like peptidase domain-containing protein [Chitinophagaceae bacterium]
MIPFKIVSTNDTDTSRGTGFVIKKENKFYLVTAKHVFYPSSTQNGYTLPDYHNSLSVVTILKHDNLLPLQKELLVDHKTETFLYNVFVLKNNQALDIAVLKINSPTNEIKQNAIPFSYLEDTIAINYDDSLRTEGYPTRNSNFYSANCSFAKKNYQDILDKDSQYYFILNSEEDLNGLSGGPIFNISDNITKSITGIFVGQNRTYKKLGYAIFSFYIKRIIETLND